MCLPPDGKVKSRFVFFLKLLRWLDSLEHFLSTKPLTIARDLVFMIYTSCMVEIAISGKPGAQSSCKETLANTTISEHEEIPGGDT